MSSVYKYFSADVFDLVFKTPGQVSLKCSLPKDYNDPYELFLGIDLGSDTEGLATYKVVVGDIPQLYTTCFSASPSSNPMWAHYGKNHSGFVVEFDREALTETIKGSKIAEVAYRDTPDDSILAHIQRASVTGKARHSMFMMDAIIHHAYFTKQTCWSYEQECRLVNFNKYMSGSILEFPTTPIRSIISGTNAGSDFDNKASKMADEIGSKFYKERIGKSYAEPFFIDRGNRTNSHSAGTISQCQFVCEKCNEPTQINEEYCPWCKITESHITDASHRSMLVAIDRSGGLDDYIRQYLSIRDREK